MTHCPICRLMVADMETLVKHLADRHAEQVDVVPDPPVAGDAGRAHGRELVTLPHDALWWIVTGRAVSVGFAFYIDDELDYAEEIKKGK